jgi:hypothetical protein
VGILSIFLSGVVWLDWTLHHGQHCAAQAEKGADSCGVGTPQVPAIPPGFFTHPAHAVAEDGDERLAGDDDADCVAED